MNTEIVRDENAVAMRAAEFIAEVGREAVRARGRFLLALSGGRTPWVMLRHLTAEIVPWDKVHIVQVDERAAPAGDKDRNLTHLQDSFLAHCPIPPQQVYPMPVESADLPAAARQYATTLQDITGSPIVLDLCHLGLGPDGHTASLVPGDPVLGITDADVAITGPYQGHPRMTLTYPAINRSRQILWVVSGSEKAGPAARLVKGDPSIPAGRVAQDHALFLADADAATTRN